MSETILTRPVPVGRLPFGGEYVLETTAAEREALAAVLGIVTLHALSARYRIGGTPERLTVRGRVDADVEQLCVVTLEPFRSTLVEPVDLSFVEGPAPAYDPAEEVEIDPDAPDPIENGRVDLGAITAEFLALGLDPYPRKPGVSFEAPAADGTASPFAALAALKRNE